MTYLRKWVFWPVSFLLIVIILVNLINEEWFSVIILNTNNWILNYFNWLFSLLTFMMLVGSVLLYFSKLGKIRIGGAQAKPILNKWQWFSITLCTTIATGILFWGTAEPIYHLQSPTNSLGILPRSNEAGVFALSTLYFHWSFIPYAIYSIPVIAFAIGYYNLKKPYSISSAILIDAKITKTRLTRNFIDGVCLLALVLGMSASLGAGILTISGGLVDLFGIPDKEISRILVAFSIIIAFIISASTGLLKGIRILSVVNVYLFFFLAIVFVVVFADLSLLKLILNSLKQFIGQFFQKSFFTIYHPQDSWGNQWTVFNWANWLAWAPVTALFLGRISVGYTVRQVLLFNLLIPSLFSIVWMSIFGGAAINMQLSQGQDMTGLLQNQGPESIIYALMKEFPMYLFIAFIFIVTVFISFVTAADSNTEAMSALSTHGFGFEKTSSPIWVKIIWGVIIGTTSYIMISFAGIDGIKILSTIGGLPILFLMALILISLIVYTIKMYLKN